MKKILQAAALIILASAAVVAAATSRHSRANNHFPNEWDSSYSNTAGDTFLKHYSTSTNK